jgi:hypothetical protein
MAMALDALAKSAAILQPTYLKIKIDRLTAPPMK